MLECLFLSSCYFFFCSILIWLTSVKHQMEEGKNRRRPLTPTCHFFALYWISILFKSQGGCQPNKTNPKPLKHKYSPKHCKWYKRRVCVCVCVFESMWLYEWGGEIWSNWRDLGLVDGEERRRWMTEKAGSGWEWIALRKQAVKKKMGWQAEKKCGSQMLQRCKNTKKLNITSDDEITGFLRWRLRWCSLSGFVWMGLS